MKWLPLLIYVLAAPTLAGSIVVAVLSLSHYSTTMLVGGALAGFVLALPVAWVVSGQLKSSMRM